MGHRKIDDDLELVPYYPGEPAALEWYQDLELCRQVDNIDHAYTAERLDAMYGYLSTHGDCYYIQYKGKLVGDVTLQHSSEISIVVCKEYQNRRIGRKCVRSMIELAKEKGFSAVKAHIYSFNAQSRAMFAAIGFVPAQEEWYLYSIDGNGRTALLTAIMAA